MTWNVPARSSPPKSRVAVVDSKDIKSTLGLPFRNNTAQVIDILPQHAYTVLDGSSDAWQSPPQTPPEGFMGLGVGIVPPAFDSGLESRTLSPSSFPPNWNELMAEIRAITMANPPRNLDQPVPTQGQVR